MSKEMFIAASPHETKVAVFEDDQLVEVYFERDTDVGLVGGIYKGRVNRVLPGMQSAFVDIGLERDAFLYVSDFFFEDQEEYDKVFEEAEARATRFAAEQTLGGAPAPAPVVEPPSRTIDLAPSAVPPPAAPAAAPPAIPTAAPEVRPPESMPAETAAAPPAAGVLTPPSAPPGETREYRRFDPRGRRRRHRGRGFGEHRFGERKFSPRPESAPPSGFEILPGESLAKYSHRTSEGARTSAEVAAPEALGAAAPTVSQALAAPQSEHAEAITIEPLPVQPTAQVEDEQPHATGETLAEGSLSVPPSYQVETLPEIEEGFPVEPAWGVLPAVPDLTQPQISAPRLEPMMATTSAEAESPVVESLEVAAPAPPSKAASREPAPTEPTPQEAAAQSPGEAVEGAAVPASSAEPAALPAPLPAPTGEAAPQEGVPVPPSTPETPSAPPERSYTLREPHQRPRFAPRPRRRGRRGMGQRPHRREGGREPSRPGNYQPVQISELLKEGQEILVQIAKEPLGTKGARITSHVALPGRYLVYMPTISHIGVSRKIASEEERLRLRNVLLENKGSLTGGFIVRTAGAGRSEEEFKADLKFLSTLWNEIRAKADRVKAPALIHRDLDLVQRILRDTLTPEFKSIRVDNEIEYERVLDFVSRSQPSLVGKVKLYTRDTPLFEEFGVQAELEKALKPKVWLKSGGYIVINQTEALVAVDVNTGKFVGKTNRLEDTILKTNIDAVNEIVRQIRMRDLGGIIVIDFIDMDERKNRAKVVQALEEALRRDRAPTKVISFHDFGLVAITRKRVKQSLERTLCEPCNYCSGSGWVKSVNTVCYEILSEARKMARQIDGEVLTLRVSPEIAKALKSREGVLISELESLTKKDVIIKSDPAVHQERYEIF